MRPSRRSSADDLFIVPLVVLLANLKVGLRMLADGTHVGSLGANHQMTAVAALPHGDAALLKDSLGLHILQQCAVTLFVGLLDIQFSKRSCLDITCRLCSMFDHLPM